jgi:hypothetical protein
MEPSPKGVGFTGMRGGLHALPESYLITTIFFVWDLPSACSV